MQRLASKGIASLEAFAELTRSDIAAWLSIDETLADDLLDKAKYAVKWTTLPRLTTAPSPSSPAEGIEASNRDSRMELLHVLWELGYHNELPKLLRIHGATFQAPDHFDMIEEFADWFAKLDGRLGPSFLQTLCKATRGSNHSVALSYLESYLGTT